MFKKILTIVFLVMFYGLLITNAFAEEESITITTYYPSPYGSYNELRAKKMGIGDTYYQGTVEIRDPADLIVEGRVGIGTTGPFGPLQVKTATNRNFLVFDYANTMTIQSVNDAGSALTAMRFRASPFVFTDGNVGIGTTGPQASQDGRTIKLDVSENIVAKDVYLDDPKTGTKRWASEVGKITFDVWSGSDARYVYAGNPNPPPCVVSVPEGYTIIYGQKAVSSKNTWATQCSYPSGQSGGYGGHCVETNLGDRSDTGPLNIIVNTDSWLGSACGIYVIAIKIQE